MCVCQNIRKSSTNILCHPCVGLKPQNPELLTWLHSDPRSSQSSQRRSFVSGSTPTTVSRTCASSRHPGVPARICGGVWRRDCKLRVLRAFRHMKSDNQSDSDKKIEAISCAKSCPARQIGVGKNLRHVTHLVLSTVGSVCG